MFYNKLLIWIKQRLFNRKNAEHDIIQGKFFNDRTFGEIIRDLEMDGKLGHFKSNSLFHKQDSEGNTCFATRNFWIEAGVNPTPIFKQYLTDKEQTIDGITDAIVFIRPVLFRLADELITLIRITSADLMLRKLFLLFDNTFKFYCKDRRTREEVAKVYSDFSDDTLENNRSITMTLLNGLSIMIENCVVFQNEEKSEIFEDKALYSVDELFDNGLLIKIYLYALMSQYYTLLNLSKDSKSNYAYCSGITVNPNDQVPIEGIIHHPLLYTSVLITGNQNVFSIGNQIGYIKEIDSTPIGQGFQRMYDIKFLDVIRVLHALVKEIDSFLAITSVGELKRYIASFNINPDKFIEYFSITRSNLKQHILDGERYIFRVGRNKYRLDIRPIVLLDNGTVYISPEALYKAMNSWTSFANNGGKPYTDIDAGHGDVIIDGFAKREQELGDRLVDILYEKLEQHYPNALYKDKNVKYHRIFGKRRDRFQDSEDYDIIYYVGDELFLIEAKYFSDSLTVNLLIGDYNKIFKDGLYYKHCRARFDLVEEEPEKMKAYIKAKNNVKVHYLFISSKPLEIEFQDEDKIVSFLCVSNFDQYLDGKLEYKDGVTLRPTHLI